ncbi:MAG TPA: phosphatidylglycerol lysyltransferase domain-containing protein [Candidatus Saccharimonadales bacterium]|nr:phosphatidylglycerol lysyltransferase domain-containing protein [Candidatus Saccharimonadales bacterium]
MVINFSRRRSIILWQILFIVIGTSWLWAPHLNPHLSYRTTLISQYETPVEPFAWLFRAGDELAGWLLLLFATTLLSRRRTAAYLLIALAVGLIADPLLSTTCHTIGRTCRPYFSLAYLLHASETVYTSVLFFVITIYDSWRRKKLTSIAASAFQFIFGLFFISQLADRDVFNSTAIQYLYQTVLIAWTAWYCRDLSAETNFRVRLSESRLVKSWAAFWAFLNGILAIIISLAHINLLGHIKGLYFSGNSAWLAQHGIIVGVIMLYLSRHLARGEARARQIFILLSGIEVLKYAVISPNPGLMIFYLASFIALFVLRDDFDRGSIALTWRVRLRDLAFLISGLVLSAFVGLILLDRDNRVSMVTNRAIDRFGWYVTGGHKIPRGHLESALLAHSISVFLAAGVAAILWVLFRPYKPARTPKDWPKVEATLKKYSKSSEDYFKLWPPDKEYFWNRSGDGFIAYRLQGTTAFGLADPIGPDPVSQIEDFYRWCASHRLKTCFLPVYPDSLSLYKKAGLETLHIGSSAIIDINYFLGNTVKDKWWRWRINKAEKSGYKFLSGRPPHSDVLLRQLKRVSRHWLKVGGHTERGFALGHFDKNYLNKCRIYYLVDDKNQVVAFTNELPQFSGNQLAAVDLFRYLPSARDPMAYLLYKTIQQLKENYSRFDLGFVPFARARGPLLAIAKTVSSERFSARGLERFKNKFDPAWQANYLAYAGDPADLAIIALNIEKLMKHKA